MKIYEMGTQSLYNPSQTNPASQALAGYNTGSVTGSTPGLDARSAIPGLGIGLDNIVGGGINAIGSYMHGENQRQKMMAQNRNQQDMTASQNSQMRRFGAVEGQQTDTVLRNEDLNSLNSSYQRMYEEGTEAVDTNASTPDSALIEVEKDELIFRRFGASYQLVADFTGGDTHEEGGEPFVAEEGDVIFPGDMRDMILPMVDDSGFVKYKFMDEFEELRQQLPEDTPQGTAENQAVSDEIIGTGMQMAEAPKFEMGGTVNPAQAEALQPMQTNVGPPTQLKQNLNVQRNEQNILNQLSGQGVPANQVAPATRMPIAGEEFAGMAGQGPINPDYKAEQPLMGNQEYVNRAREQAMLNEQKTTLFPQQQEAMQKAIDKRENKGRVSNRFGNSDSLIQTNGMSAGDFMFALGQDVDYQTQQNMRNYQSQYPMGTKYYKPKRYDEGTASAKPTPKTSNDPTMEAAARAYEAKMLGYKKQGYSIQLPDKSTYKFSNRDLARMPTETTGGSAYDYYMASHGGYKNREGRVMNQGSFKDFIKSQIDSQGYSPTDKRRLFLESLDPDNEDHQMALLDMINTGNADPNNIMKWQEGDLGDPGSGTLAWKFGNTFNMAPPNTNVTYTDKIVTRDVPKEVINNQTQLEVQKEMVPTSINDNRTFNDSRSRWQNNNQGNAISGHFNSGGYSIDAQGNINFIPGGGINIGNQYSTQNQNDYNQGMYGGAGGSGVEAVKSYNDAEATRVQQKQQAVNTENDNNANKIITAQQEANSRYQSNKTAAINEAMSGNEAARKAVMEQQAANRQAEIGKAVQAGADPDALQKEMGGIQQSVPEPPKEIKEYRKGTKYTSKYKLYFNQDGGDYKSNDDITLNQKFKGNIGDGAVVGNAMAVSGSGNNLNANKSYTGNQIHNIRTGHDINIGGTRVNSDILNRLLTPQPTENKSTEPYLPKYAGDDTYNSPKPSVSTSKSSGSTDKSDFKNTKPDENLPPNPFTVKDSKSYDSLSNEEKQLDDFLNLLNTLIPSRKLTPGELDKQNRGLTIAYPETPKIPVANRNLQRMVYEVPKKVNQTEQAIRSGTMVGPRTPDKYLDNHTTREIEDLIKKFIIPLGGTKYRRGSKSVSKDRTESDTRGSVNTEDSDVDLNQKFKGDIGSESMAGVGTGIMGQGNNINQNRSITGDQIHNIRAGHNINIGNLGGMDGLDPNIDMKSLGKSPKIKRYKDSATALGPMGMQSMNTTNVNLEQKNYADLSDPMRLAAQNATMQATQAGAMAGGGAGLAGVIAAQNQGLDTRLGVEAAEAARLNQTQQANVDIRNQSTLTNAQNKIAVDQFNTSNAQSLASANKGIEAQNVVFKQSAIKAANDRALQQAALDQRNRELAVQVGLAGLTAKTQMGMANRQLASDVVNNALTSTGGGVKTPTGPPAPPVLPPNPPGDIVPQAPEIRNRLQQLYAPNPNAEVPTVVDIPGEGEQKLKHGTKYKKVRKFAR